MAIKAIKRRYYFARFYNVPALPPNTTMTMKFLTAASLLFAALLPARQVLFAAPGNFSDSTEEKNIVVPVKSNTVVFPAFLNETDAENALSYVQNFCNTRKDQIFSSYKRSRKLYPKVTAILKKYGLPADFRVLLTIESDCNPNVISNAGAVGYWQFIDAAASDYGLKYVHQLTPNDREKLKKENPKKADSIIKATAKLKDDRKDFNKSTNAAARYLRDRMKNLGGDMLLVAASYNCGIGNVRNAMYKSGETNPTFWDIKPYLPKETQNYVMKFIAFNTAFNNYELLASGKINFDIKKNKETLQNENPDGVTAADAKPATNK